MDNPPGVEPSESSDFGSTVKELPGEGEIQSMAALTGVEPEKLQRGLETAKAAADKLKATVPSLAESTWNAT